MAAILQPFIDRNVVTGAVAIVVDVDQTFDLEAVGYASKEDQGLSAGSFGHRGAPSCG